MVQLKLRFHGDQVLINVSSSSTVLELKKLLAAEISVDLRTEVFSENIYGSIGFVLAVSKLLAVHDTDFRI